MSNYVIQRPETVSYCTTASAYEFATSASALAGAASLGSVREFTFETSAETLYATSTTYNDAKVASLVSGYEGTITAVCEELTSSAMKLAFAQSVSGTDFYNDASATTPVNYAIIAEPFWVDGSAYTLVVTKCHAIPGASRKLGKEQELLELKFAALVDTDASAGKKWYRLLKQ